jgi:hypothetical protein
VSQGGDVGMPKWREAMRLLMGILGILQGLAGMLVPREVILLSMLLGNPMGVRRAIVQFGGALVVHVMRSVVIMSRHG